MKERYQIRIKGQLDPTWVEWFDGFTIESPAEHETLLTGQVCDQADYMASCSVLRNLGVELLGVQHIQAPQ